MSIHLLKKLVPVIFVLILTNMAFSAEAGDRVLFEDPLNGDQVKGWKSPPIYFHKHPDFGWVYRIETAEGKFLENPPSVGDLSWKRYRIEIEILPTGGHWVGVDFHVQEDGKSGCNLQIFTFDRDYEEVMESTGFWGTGLKGATSWKLWPVSQRKVKHVKGKWMKVTVDVGETVANVYINDEEKPYYTIYDLPFQSGGVRLFSFHNGHAYLRNFRVTELSEDVKPILEDEWAKVRNLNPIKKWKVIQPKEKGFAVYGIPDALTSEKTEWVDATADERGVVNLGAMFPEKNTEGVVFGKAIINSNGDETRKGWVTYTDRFKMWLNGEQVFIGLPRGWNDSESNHDCRLKPDQFEVELKLKKGENEILIRSEVTENWGWGYWMRIE